MAISDGDDIKGNFKKHKINDELAKEICGDFTFDLAMLQDQGQIKVESKEYRPVICFDNLNGELKFNSDEDCQLHEYAFGNVDLAFE